MPEYRDISGFPGYRVGSDGTVWSSLRRVRRDLPWQPGGTWRMLRQNPDSDGYMQLTLCANGGKRLCKVHVLVLTAFRGPRPDGMHGSHDDGNKENNQIANLFWKPPAVNEQDKKRHGTSQEGERHWKSKLTNNQAAEIKRRYREGATQVSLASEFGVSQQTVSMLVTGRTWQCLEGAGVEC